MIEISKKEKLTVFDLATHIKDDEDALFYLNDALESNNITLIKGVLNDIARAKGMSSVSEKTGITREALYKALSEKGNPRMDTLFNLFKALNISLKPVMNEQVKIL
jgi:probable addiction module antidote protein